MSQDSRRYQALDGIRFYSALLVFLVHMTGALATDAFRIPESALVTNSPDPFISGLAILANFGHHGVDLFFLVSGFLMVKISMNRPGIAGALQFLKKRFLRIYPAFAVALILGAFIRCWIFGWPFKSWDFLLNFLFLNAIPSMGIIPYNFVSWSLGYEFAFYVLVPLIALGTDSKGKLIISSLLLVVSSLIIPETFIRFNGLIVGAIIGSISDKTNERIAASSNFVILLGSYLAVSIAWVLHLISMPLYMSLFLPISALLLIKVTFQNNHANLFFSHKIFIGLGRVSYSFYLWHTVCISLAMNYIIVPLRISGSTPFGITTYVLLSLVISLATGAVSYQLFEKWYFTGKRVH